MKSNRRNFIRKLGLGTVGIGGVLSTNCSPSEEDEFSIVHLTDTHVTSRRQGHKGYQACVNSINALTPAVDFVLMGGDMVFDGLYNEMDEYEDQIRLFKEISGDLNVPYYPCLGNHDVLGLSSRRKVPADHPGIGQKHILDALGMESAYYSFNHKGWHFVVLNSIHEIEMEHGPAYEQRIGKEQLDWLRYDLGDHLDMPTIVVSHYAAFNHLGQINADQELKAMNHLVLKDNKELRNILERHGVKAMLQGHTHMSEDFRFNNVWYITSQSGSAAWWGGNWLGFEPGYTVLTLGKNDIKSWKAVTYNWTHQLEPEDTLEQERILEREEFNARQDSLYRAEITG
jgi:3',5'-cyclic AMP phosphodiesterase CpdA